MRVPCHRPSTACASVFLELAAVRPRRPRPLWRCARMCSRPRGSMRRSRRRAARSPAATRLRRWPSPVRSSTSIGERPARLRRPRTCWPPSPTAPWTRCCSRCARVSAGTRVTSPRRMQTPSRRCPDATSPPRAALIRGIEGEQHTLTPGRLPPVQVPPLPPSVSRRSPRVLHLVSTSRPWVEAGFAIRTHEVGRAQLAAGLGRTSPRHPGSRATWASTASRRPTSSTA